MYPPPQHPRYPSGPTPAAPSYPSGSQSYAGAPQSYPSAPPQSYPTPAPSQQSAGYSAATTMGPTAQPRQSEGNLATSMLKILRPGKAADAPAGSVKIGRATDNDIVIPDVLASRHHATLIPSPSGTEIRDNRSINGTFVNGARVDSAMLRDGDVVTIGNVDLVFAGGTLARRSETEAATRTGGLEVHGVTWTIEGNKTLLDNISLTARPGTLTAVIGPSGAGKSTFARLVAGYTHPTTGTVSFEGHNIHSEYASLRSRIGMVPQDDVVHGQLTVRQALMYAAELRLPPDTSKEERAQVVAQVLEELDLTKHADTRVDKLSGGQRKRAPWNVRRCNFPAADWLQLRKSFPANPYRERPFPEASNPSRCHQKTQASGWDIELRCLLESRGSDRLCRRRIRSFRHRRCQTSR